jgi:hypothetical protein
MQAFDNSDLVTNRTAVLVDGDPLAPNNSDLLTVTGRLNVGTAVPSGWRVLTGNQWTSLVVATAYRSQITPLDD